MNAVGDDSEWMCVRVYVCVRESEYENDFCSSVCVRVWVRERDWEGERELCQRSVTHYSTNNANY